jgi:hypothetical protein
MKESHEVRMKKNGKIGDLQLEKYTYLRCGANKRELDFDVSMQYL